MPGGSSSSATAWPARGSPTELRGHDPDAERVAITVVGDEPHVAYNRVLLSTVLAGSLDLDAVHTWQDDAARRPAARCRGNRDRPDRQAGQAFRRWRGRLRRAGAGHRRTAVVARCRRTAHRAGHAGTRHVDFRSRDDCERIVAERTARPAGRGARRWPARAGDRARPGRPWLPGDRRPPDGAPAGPAARSGRGRTCCAELEATRVSSSASAHRPSRYLPGDGLKLADGGHVPGELVVVSAGVRPRTELATGGRTGRGPGCAGGRRPAHQRPEDSRDRRLRAARHHGWRPGAARVRPGGGARRAADRRRPGRALQRHAGGDAAQGQRRRPGGVGRRARRPERRPSGRRRGDLRAGPGPGPLRQTRAAHDRVAGAILLGLPDAAATIIQLFDSQAPAPATGWRCCSAARCPVRQRRFAGRSADVALVCRCNTVSKAALRRPGRTAHATRRRWPRRPGPAPAAAAAGPRSATWPPGWPRPDRARTRAELTPAERVCVHVALPSSAPRPGNRRS